MIRGRNRERERDEFVNQKQAGSWRQDVMCVQKKELSCEFCIKNHVGGFEF